MPISHPSRPRRHVHIDWWEVAGKHVHHHEARQVRLFIRFGSVRGSDTLLASMKTRSIPLQHYSLRCHPQASSADDFLATLPSASLDETSTYFFGLNVTTALGVRGEASVEVFKSPNAIPALKVRPEIRRRATSTVCRVITDLHRLLQRSPGGVRSSKPIQQRINKGDQTCNKSKNFARALVDVPIMCHVAATQIAGSAYRRHWRGLPLTLRAEVSLPYSEDDNATYTWTAASESSVTADFPPLVLTSGRNPRVLTIPAYSLGYAGSVYVLRVDLAGGTQSATSATATGGPLRGEIEGKIICLILTPGYRL